MTSYSIRKKATHKVKIAIKKQNQLLLAIFFFNYCFENMNTNLKTHRSFMTHDKLTKTEKNEVRLLFMYNL